MVGPSKTLLEEILKFLAGEYYLADAGYGLTLQLRGSEGRGHLQASTIYCTSSWSVMQIEFKN
jgi:hypothetical protein